VRRPFGPRHPRPAGAPAALPIAFGLVSSITRVRAPLRAFAQPGARHPAVSATVTLDARGTTPTGTQIRRSPGLREMAFITAPPIA
jgi:hypothetical protein